MKLCMESNTMIGIMDASFIISKNYIIKARDNMEH